MRAVYPISPEDDMGLVRIKVEDIDGQLHVLEVEEDAEQSICDIAEDRGIEIPYSCRSGACYTCCAEIHRGGKWLEQDKTGEKLIDVEPGEFLCCIGGVKSEAFDGDRDKEIELKMLN